jgi:hypothetical protein
MLGSVSQDYVDTKEFTRWTEDVFKGQNVFRAKI